MPLSGNNRPKKTAMLVAERIVRDAVQNGLKPGDFLPPERTMLEQYNTGRGTLREALRLLEFQAVIALKPGPGGGPVLLSPDASHLASTVVLLMELSSAPFRTIVEVRSAMEPMMGSLAAQRIDDAALVDLKRTIDQMAEHIYGERIFLDANKRFHDIIAWSSGNLLFAYIVDSLLGIMDGTIIGIDYPSFRRKAILKAHDEIYAALASRDAKAAEERMREHIDAYVTYAERKFPEVMDRVIPWGQYD